ncbi:hypothetical protein FWF74_02970 [Candidatus Saccharibacteria bacterium]|nr:hypothetical protein [Candidatus Saccharibacteria bacterium]MCL1962944.1 hypothetical protein [Candidatus Saccharibacteria bacterium]
MILIGFFSWWYGDGWRAQILRIKSTLAKYNDMFSISLLAKTLFSPFHQISADAEGNDIRSQLRAFGDRMFSRCIGAFVRTFMIIVGLIVLFFVLILSLVRLVIWPILLFMPAIGLILMLTLRTPWTLI